MRIRLGKPKAYIINDTWVVNLRSKSIKEKIMDYINIAIKVFVAMIGIGCMYCLIKMVVDMCKKKIKRFSYGGCPITEQEYVDGEFKNIRKQMETTRANLREGIEILKALKTKDYIFIDPISGRCCEVSGEHIRVEKARDQARKEGYSYIKSFENNGELWVKENQK